MNIFKKKKLGMRSNDCQSFRIVLFFGNINDFCNPLKTELISLVNYNQWEVQECARDRSWQLFEHLGIEFGI